MDMKLYLQILANASGLKREMVESRTAVARFTQGARHEFNALRSSIGTVQGKLASLGLGIGAVQLLSQSARLDKGLIQLKQTAGETSGAIGDVRHEFFQMSKETGQQVEGLKDGFDSLIQSGQSWKAALQSTKGINIASGVTGAQQKTLAGGLTVGANAFNIDLEQPGKALELLDKMTVAGRQGWAELENLADIFSRVGVNAASAGMGYDKTLAFIEGLSLSEKQPERLATLADSTLRIFTNLKYMASAQNGTGVKFFADDGSRRDPIAVLKDIKTRWDVLKNDRERAVFMQKSFGHADLDTIRGLRSLLSGGTLHKIDTFTGNIGHAGGTLKRELPEAINNAVDQVGRLKTVLREAGDEFAQLINQAVSKGIKHLLDSKDKGGLGLSGRDLLKYGVGGGAGALLLARYGGKGIGALAGKLLSRSGSTAIGVAEGKALQATAGITPVFVTNWPAGQLPGAGGASGPSRLLPLASLGLGTAVVAAPFVSAGIGSTARANGWGSRTFARDSVEYQVMGVHGRARSASVDPQALVNNDLLTRLVRPGGQQKNNVTINMRVDQQGRAWVESRDPNTRAELNQQRGDFGAALLGGNF